MDEYLKALQAQQERERAQEDIINAYTKLADRYAEAQKLQKTSAAEPDEKSEKRASIASRIPPSITGARGPTPQRTASDSPPQLRADLTAANKTIHELHMQAASAKDEIETLNNKVATSDKKTAQLQSRISKLEAERVTLQRRLRDKDGELREKDRMVNDVQDEMVGMEMQMNMAEDRSKQLEKENKDLVDRWMKRVGNEAEEMNKGSGWE